jgi:hypothetical protein
MSSPVLPPVFEIYCKSAHVCADLEFPPSRVHVWRAVQMLNNHALCMSEINEKVDLGVSFPRILPCSQKQSLGRNNLLLLQLKAITGAVMCSIA